MEDIKKQIDDLKKKILYHNDLYYNQDNPEIEDAQYDELMRQLKKLEAENPELITKDSPTQKVGGVAKREAGVLVKHDVPMLSLQDVFSAEEVETFVDNMQKELDNPEFVVEEKIDGLSLALRYVDGELKLAVTRGDGVVQGEDVTANAMQIKDIKKKLKEKKQRAVICNLLQFQKVETRHHADVRESYRNEPILKMIKLIRA